MDNGGKIVFLIFMILIVSAILREIKKKTNIPFSPMLLVVGLILGIFEESLGFVGECVRLLNGIDPHSLLMIFIPGLVFEGSYNTDTYVFGKSKWQVLILAGPGVVMTSVALAYVLKHLLGYGDLSVSEALVIGSVIATTDPVAVVALLKELGASTRFRTMIEGESLLNDGTAFVFFLICMDVVKSGSLHYGTAFV